MQIDYRGLSLVETPVGDAATAIKNNFITLADRTGPMTIHTIDPTATDDSTQGYVVWSKWYNAVTSQVFVCMNDSPGVAEWQSYNDLSVDATPTLSADLIAGEHVLNVRNISSDTATVMTMKDMRFKVTGAIDFNGNDITNFGGWIYFNYVSANNTITSDTGSLSLSASSIKLGGMHHTWPSGIGADSSYLCNHEGAGLVFETSVDARACSAGTVCMWPTMTAPAGWVLCDGSTYDGSSSTYVYLYHQIGHTYGGTVPNFVVPDYRGRSLFGMDGTTEFYYLNTTGGTKTVGSLNSTHIPPHSHAIYSYHATTTGAPGCSSSWSSSTTSCGTTGQTGSTGGGTAHNNLNPYATVCWIIKL